ncbi:MAG: hypothetical protein HC922_09985 [Leptolyngbyaceae cyanobacterium SM2_3_12]|nr:hypothetical protein [Leptolyngbyaceae cyanobacterium SM2_3_12]
MELTRTANDIVDHRYRILTRLGQGGSGITYAAESLATGSGSPSRNFP